MKFLGPIAGLTLIALWLLPGAALAQPNLNTPSTPTARLLWDTARQLSQMTGLAKGVTWEPAAAPAKAAVAEGATKIAAYLKETGRVEEITDPGKQGISPLAQAVALGFVEVVDVFLVYPEVRATLNEPFVLGDQRTFLWAVANAAPLLAPTFCGARVELAMAYIVSAAYLEAFTDETPYLRVRRSLEAAGAMPRPDEARAIWTYVCPDPNITPTKTMWSDGPGIPIIPEIVPGSRARVAAAPDLLIAVDAEMATLRQLRIDGKAPVNVTR